jgi:hypothetical protein
MGVSHNHWFGSKYKTWCVTNTRCLLLSSTSPTDLFFISFSLLGLRALQTVSTTTVILAEFQDSLSINGYISYIRESFCTWTVFFVNIEFIKILFNFSCVTVDLL